MLLTAYAQALVEWFCVLAVSLHLWPCTASSESIPSEGQRLRLAFFVIEGAP